MLPLHMRPVRGGGRQERMAVPDAQRGWDSPVSKALVKKHLPGFLKAYLVPKSLSLYSGGDRDGWSGTR